MWLCWNYPPCWRLWCSRGGAHYRGFLFAGSAKMVGAMMLCQLIEMFIDFFLIYYSKCYLLKIFYCHPSVALPRCRQKLQHFAPSRSGVVVSLLYSLALDFPSHRNLWLDWLAFHQETGRAASQNKQPNFKSTVSHISRSIQWPHDLTHLMRPISQLTPRISLFLTLSHKPQRTSHTPQTKTSQEQALDRTSKDDLFDLSRQNFIGRVRLYTTF